jgi:PAS domain S-box-containing protein
MTEHCQDRPAPERDRDGSLRQPGENERRYRELLDLAVDGFWEIDAERRFTYISAGYEAVFGISIADTLGKRLGELPGVTVAPEMAQKVLAAIDNRQPFRDFVCSRERRPGAQKLWMHGHGTPFFDEHGHFQGYRGVARDITAQIEAEHALRASEQRFKQLCEAAYDYFWETDAGGRGTFLSPNFEAIFGVPASKVLGGRIMDLPGFRMEPGMQRTIAAALMARQPYRDLVFSVRWPDGTEHWVEVSAVPFFENGEFRGYRGVGADVTAQRLAEEAARLAEGRLQDAVARVRQPFVLYDAADRVVALNQAFAALHPGPDGRTAVDKGASFRDIAVLRLENKLYAPEAAGEVVDLAALLHRHLSDGEHVDRLADGRWMLVDHRRLPGGGSFELWTDVSVIKRAESDRRVLEAQLHHSQRLEALGTLAGGAAHEINNALVPVIALTKMVASHLPEDGRDRRSLATVLVGAERSRDLVKQILAFSRKEEKTQRLEDVDLAIVLRDALQLMRATVPTSIRLVEEIAPPATVAGDPGQLHQVVVNLVANAAQAIGDGHGTITVGLRADGAALRLFVTDTGCGMDEATKARIFEPFFTTKEVGKGTGLGLAVVHGIVERHGGRIEVASAPGRGTRFDVILPLLSVASGAAARTRQG